MLVRKQPTHEKTPEILLASTAYLDNGEELNIGPNAIVLDNISVTENSYAGQYETHKQAKLLQRTTNDPNMKFTPIVLNMN